MLVTLTIMDFEFFTFFKKKLKKNHSTHAKNKLHMISNRLCVVLLLSLLCHSTMAAPDPAKLGFSTPSTAANSGVKTGDGAADSPQSTLPSRGMCINKDGTLYMADGASSVIRQASFTIAITDSVSTTIGGFANTPGTADGEVSISRFNSPADCIVTSDGTAMYIADTGNNLIRKLMTSTPYVVSTFAGQAGIQGLVDSYHLLSKFNSPLGITMDNSQNIYIVDSGNAVIRKIHNGGNIVSKFST